MSVMYLLSSLPMLNLDTAPAVTVASFLSACRGELSEADADACEALLKDLPSGHPFVKEWRDKDAVLRNAAARSRARAHGQDASRWLRPTADCDVMLEHLAETAFQTEDPMQREKALDRARWTAIEEIQGVDRLGLPRVFAYAVKLGMACKWHGLAQKAGREAFEKLTEVPIAL